MAQTESRDQGAWKLPDELRLMADGGDAELVQEVLAVFQTDTEARLQSLEAALAEGNLTQVRNQAHSIKGSASQVGSPGMAAICQRIELEAARMHREDLAEAVQQAKAVFAEVCRLISANPI